MATLHLEVLERFRARYQTLLAGYEDVGMKRARADGQLALLLQEVSEVLPGEQQQVIAEILALHESLWSSSPAPRGSQELEDCRIHPPNSLISRTIYVDQKDEERGPAYTWWLGRQVLQPLWRRAG